MTDPCAAFGCIDFSWYAAALEEAASESRDQRQGSRSEESILGGSSRFQEAGCGGVARLPSLLLPQANVEFMGVAMSIFSSVKAACCTGRCQC